jgi:hypothetical protein
MVIAALASSSSSRALDAEVHVVMTFDSVQVHFGRALCLLRSYDSEVSG